MEKTTWGTVAYGWE